MAIGEIYADEEDNYYVKTWGGDYLSLNSLHEEPANKLEYKVQNVQEIFEKIVYEVKDNYNNSIPVEKGDYLVYIAEDVNARFSGIVYNCTYKGFDLVGDNWNSLFICNDSKDGSVIKKIIKRKDLLSKLALARNNG